MADDIPQNTDAAYEQAFAPDKLDPLAADQAQQQAQVAPQAPAQPQSGPINVINPAGKLVSIPGEQLGDALQAGYTHATDQDLDKYTKDQKYGGLGQQALTALEGAGEGATFGLSAGAERLAGVNPQDILGRAETNPIAHNAGQVAGLVGSAFIPGVGEANLLKGAGEGAAALTGLGKAGSGLISQVGADTVKAAFEGALFQGGEEASKAFLGDPNQTAEHAIGDIGLASVLGGIFGGTVGAALRGGSKILGVSAPGGAVAPVVGAEAEHSIPPQFVSELDRPKLDAGDFQTNIEHSNNLSDTQKSSIVDGIGSDMKPEAADITAAAQRLNAPVLEGMVSNNKWVQKGEDALINGAPTYSGIARSKLYDAAYNTASTAVDDALGEGSKLSKAELGNNLKQSITSQIKTANEPIAQMYNTIKQYHSIVPLAQDAAKTIGDDIGKMNEIRLSPSSPGAKIAQNVLDELPNVKTVDDLKAYRSSLYDRLSPTAPPAERRVVAIIADKLKGLEDSSIENFASTMPNNDEGKAVIQSLIGQRKMADDAYKPFIKDVSTLADQLGKGRIHGAQDAINFINDLTPEQVTQKLFSKNDSEFLNFFAKKFPNEMKLMQAYQKQIIREGASKTGELSPKLVFNQVNKLEPEIQKSIFNNGELQKLQDSETYLRSFPKNFNPSGTSGMDAFRSFFEHPTGAAISNVRDFAIDKFIKAVGQSPEIKNATMLGKATAKGYNTAQRAVKSLFESGDKATLPAAITANVVGREKIKKLVDDYTQNPQKMLDMNANNPVPQYNQAFAATSARAVQYLNSIKPSNEPASPLDKKLPLTSAQTAKYDRQVDIAQNPLMVLKHMNEGTLTPTDLVTLKQIYPNLYNSLSGQMNDQMMKAVSKGKIIPYTKRLGMSMFQGQALDSTMTPQGILGAQPQPATPPANPPGPTKNKRNTSSLGKMNKMYQTNAQSAESDRNSRD